MWRGPKKNVSYMFVLTSTAVSSMSCSLDLYGFRDGGAGGHIAAICRMLLPRFVQGRALHSYSIAIKLFSPLRFVSIHVVHPYSSMNTTGVSKVFSFITNLSWALLKIPYKFTILSIFIIISFPIISGCIFFFRC